MHRSTNVTPRNTICLWYDGTALDAARFYAETFADSAVGAVYRAPGDYPSGKEGDVLTVEFTVLGIPCLGLNGGPMFKHSEAFSFLVATDDQAETDRLWNAIVGNGGQESACGWCKDKWGLSVADHAARPVGRDRRPRPRGGQARVRRDDADAEDRHRGDRGRPARLTVKAESADPGYTSRLGRTRVRPFRSSPLTSAMRPFGPMALAKRCGRRRCRRPDCSRSAAPHRCSTREPISR